MDGGWLSVGFGLATLAWLGDVKAYNGLVTRASLAPAAGVAGAGFIALVLAYQSTPRLFRQWACALDRSLGGRGTMSSNASGIWALWGVSMLAQAIGYARGSVGYLAHPSAALSTSSSANAVLSLLAQLGLLATVMAGWRAGLKRRPGSMALLMWVATSQLLLGLFSGMKEAAVIQLVAILVGYSARGRLRSAPLVIACLIALFVVTPFVTAYRTVLLNGSSRLSPAESLASIDFYQMMIRSTSQNEPGQLFAESADRLSRIGDVAIIMGKTPAAVPYISPVELISGPVLGFVPRSVWPDKPVLDAGYQVNQQYYEMPSNIYSSAAVTPYGDLYRHGGVGIVILGMAILGLFVRSVDDRGTARSDLDPRLLFLPMLMFTMLVKQEMDYVALTASLVSMILTAALAGRLVSRRSV